MSSRRRGRGPWITGVRDLDEVVGGRPLRERPSGRRSDREEEPGPTARSRREGWNRHVVGASADVDGARIRRASHAA